MNALKKLLTLGCLTITTGYAQPDSHYDAYKDVRPMLKKGVTGIPLYLPSQTDMFTLMEGHSLLTQSVHISPQGNQYCIEFALSPHCNGSSVCSQGSFCVSGEQPTQWNHSTNTSFTYHKKNIPAQLSFRGSFRQFQQLSWVDKHLYFQLKTKTASIRSLASRVMSTRTTESIKHSTRNS